MKVILLARAAILAAFWVLSFNAAGQTAADPNEGSKISYDNVNSVFTVSWWGRLGRTYFIQQSDDLMTWNYLPDLIESGTDETIEWGFTSSADRFFVRLKYIDIPTTDPFNDDFDGDKVSNIDELSQGTDPLYAHIDSNGLPDDWQIRYFGVLHIDANADPDGDGLTNAQEWQAGTHPLQMAAPTFAPAAQSSAVRLNVTITCLTPGAIIYYTFDGSDPTETNYWGTTNSGGIVSVGRTLTLKAKAYQPSNHPTQPTLIASTVASAAYSVTGAIDAGTVSSMALRWNRTAVGWGSPAQGRLGNGTTAATPVVSTPSTPVSSSADTTFNDLIAIACGKNDAYADAHTLYLKQGGSVWASGRYADGRLGFTPNPLADQGYPGQVVGISDVVEIAAGESFSMARKSDGTVWTWGADTYGKLGNGSTLTADQTIPGQVKLNSNNSVALTGITAIAAGNDHALALKDDGTVWAWGLNTGKQLGDTTTTNKSAAVQVVFPVDINLSVTPVQTIGCGQNFSFAVLSNGDAYAWGENASKTLAQGTTSAGSTTDVPSPQRMKNSGAANDYLTNVDRISGGLTHTLILKRDGTVWACGDGAGGKLGNGSTTTDQPFPSQVRITSTPLVYLPGVAGTQIVDIAAGGSHSVALRSDGAIFTWGLATSGQLGNGDTASSTASLATAYSTLPKVLNQSPVASAPTLVNPVLIAPGLVTLHANVSDADGSIDHVDFYTGAGNTFLGRATGASGFNLDWTQDLAIGTYSVTSVVWDETGASTTSPPLSFTVTPPTVTVSATPAGAVLYEATTGNQGSFVLTRSSPRTTVPLTVSYTIGGSAINGSDYQSVPNTATIGVGQTQVSVPITVLEDAIADNGKTIVLTLATSPNYTNGNPSSKTLTVNEPMVTVSATGNSASESTASPGEYTISMTAGGIATTRAALPISITYSMSGTAGNGSDYRTLGGSVILPVNESSVVVPLFPIDDNIVEPSKTAVLALSAGAYVIGSPSSGTVTINDGLPVVSITTVIDEATEENTSPARLLVSRSGATTGELTVPLGYSGTATGGDYTASTSAVLPIGKSSTEVLVSPIDDSLDEGDETVVATISANAAYVVGQTASALVHIVDNERKPTVSIVAIQATLSEEGDAVDAFTVTRSGNPRGTLTVNYLTGGSATSGSDYSALAGSVVLADGISSAIVAVQPIDDSAIEGSEAVVVNLIPSATYTIGGSGSANVALIDADPTAARPQLSPPGGMFPLDPVLVTVTCSTVGATLHYTTNGSDPTVNDPVIVSGGTLTLADSHQLRVKAWASGANPSPQAIGNYLFVGSISAGDVHSARVATDGTVWTCGLNSSGQLGNGGTASSNVWIQVMLSPGVPFTNASEVAAGGEFTLARKTDGTVWAWGSNG